jgi:hypothetical protein
MVLAAVLLYVAALAFTRLPCWALFPLSVRRGTELPTPGVSAISTGASPEYHRSLKHSQRW